MKRVGSATFAFFLALSGPAGAYPIFYSCDAAGRANDILDTKDIQAKVLSALSSPNSDSEIAMLCRGQEECFAVLKQALLLTRSSAEAANRIYRKEVEAIDAKTAKLQADLKIDRAVPETAKNLIVMANAINECRKEQLGLLPGSFIYDGHAASDGDNGKDLFILHGVDNEYLLVSGIGKTDDKNRKTNYDAVGTVIRDAVAANVDPYMALAVAYLEAGKAEPFTLDPAPAIQLMGCATERIATLNDADSDRLAAKEDELRSSGQPFFYNWGTFYRMTPAVSASATATKFYALMNKVKGAEESEIIRDEPGLACVQNEGAFLAKANGEVVETYGSDADFRKAKACCIKIPYLSSRIFSVMSNFALGEKLKGGGDPAQMLQGFNGYGVIGITEKAGVGAFRYGMRMRDQPQYGAQGMDFILNSFMNNPMIREFVRRAEDEYGNRPKSLICAGKSPGTYAFDSERYVDLQRGMKRLNTVIGKSWGAMSGLERDLVRWEYGFVNDLKGKDHPNLSVAENRAFQAAIGELNRLGDETAKWNFYRSNVYPYRDTLGKTSMRSWRRLDDAQILEIRRKILAAPAQAPTGP